MNTYSATFSFEVLKSKFSLYNLLFTLLLFYTKLYVSVVWKQQYIVVLKYRYTTLYFSQSQTN